MAAAIASGIVLKSYRFDKYRTQEKPADKPKLKSVAMATSAVSAARNAYGTREAVNAGVMLTRDLVSEPANVLTPKAFAEIAKGLAGRGLEVKVLGPKDMEKLGMGALLGVAQGSVNEPRVVVYEWKGGSKNDSTLAFCRQRCVFRLRWHQPQAGSRHVGHEMGYGRCRGCNRTDEGVIRAQGQGQCGWCDRVSREHARRQSATSRRCGYLGRWPNNRSA